ncbi:MAG TPA: DUF6295 family protein [Acidimicrobiales bacterium]|nr:DUF6295 family protein [Acidimicrobiales bacterium]
MCTYQTTSLTVQGSGKGTEGWFTVSAATVYLDHPVHAGADHTLNIDLRNPERGPGARVAVELDPASARALAIAILQTLDDAPPGLVVVATEGATVDGVSRSHRNRGRRGGAS